VHKLVPATSLLWALLKSRVCDYGCDYDNMYIVYRLGAEIMALALIYMYYRLEALREKSGCIIS